MGAERRMFERRIRLPLSDAKGTRGGYGKPARAASPALLPSARTAIAAIVLLAAFAFALACAWPATARAAVAGDFEVTLASGGDAQEGVDYSYENNVLTIVGETPVVVSMAQDGATALTDRIVVDPGSAATAHVTLAGVSIDLSQNDVDAAALLLRSGSLDLVLAAGSDNSLHAGGWHAGLENAQRPVAIGGEGSLEARGGDRGAGIGGAWGSTGENITITGGTVVARAGTYGAGIGGGGGSPTGQYGTIGGNYCGRNIAITGGTVEAHGAGIITAGGAGIGGGMAGAGEDIAITGGTVSAYGAGMGAGIGGGSVSAWGETPHGKDITISGGTVVAVGATSWASGYSGAGIGGGGGFSRETYIAGGAAVNVVVSGGYVSASSIGVGSNAMVASTIEITGGYFAESRSALPSEEHARGLACGVEPAEGFATTASNVEGYPVRVVAQSVAPAGDATIGNVTVASDSGSNFLTYGDVMTVEVQANFLGAAAASALGGDAVLDAFSASVAASSNDGATGAIAHEASAPQMALFLGDEQISNTAAPDENGVYRLTYDTTDRRIQAGGVTTELTAKFLGGGDTQGVDVTLASKPVEIGVDYVASTVYNGTTDAYGELSARGTVEGEDVALDGAISWTSPAAGTDEVVTDDVTLGEADQGWYVLSDTLGVTQAPDGASIEKAPLTIKADDATVVYGEEFAPTVSFDGFVDGEDAVVLDGTIEVSCDYEPGDAVGTYPITVSGVTSDDYEITFVAGTLTVERREATFAWSNPGRETGDGDAVTAQVSNALPGDDVFATVADGDVASAGKHTARVVAIDGADEGNYRMPSSLEATCDYVVADASGAVSPGAVVRPGGSDPTTAFTYGDAIEMTVTPTDSVPDGARMALFWEGVQLCDPVLAYDGSFTMSYDTTRGLVPTGAATIVARYVSEAPTADAWSAEVTLSPKPLTARIVGYATGTDDIAKAYDGTADANEVADVALDGILPVDEGQVLAAANVRFDSANAGETALHAYGLFVTGNEKASFYCLNDTALAGTSSTGIQKREIAWTPELFTKVYDGTTEGELATLSFEGLAEGDQLFKNADYRVVSVELAGAGIFEGREATVSLELTDSPRAANYTLAEDELSTTADIVVGPLVAVEHLMQRFENGAVVGDLQGPEILTVDGEEVRGTLAWYHDDNWYIEQTPVDPDEELHDGSNTLYWFFTPDDENYARAYGAVTALVANGAACPLADYADLATSAWYHYSVDWAIENDVMTGYAGTDPKLFGPLDSLTRAQMAQVFYNLAGKPAVDPAAVSQFADCDVDAWYAPAVAWCAEQGVFLGYGDGSLFGPDDGMTREQMAVVLWRDAGQPEGAGYVEYFPDGDETSAWARDAVAWAQGLGILRGDSMTGELNPTDGLQRAQAAAMVMRDAQLDAN